MTENMAGTKIWCPFYRGVHLIWVSILRGLTVLSSDTRGGGGGGGGSESGTLTKCRTFLNPPVNNRFCLNPNPQSEYGSANLL